MQSAVRTLFAFVERVHHKDTASVQEGICERRQPVDCLDRACMCSGRNGFLSFLQRSPTASERFHVEPSDQLLSNSRSGILRSNARRL